VSVVAIATIFQTQMKAVNRFFSVKTSFCPCCDRKIHHIIFCVTYSWYCLHLSI